MTGKRVLPSPGPRFFAQCAAQAPKERRARFLSPRRRSRFFQAGRAGARGGRPAARRRTTAPCCSEKRDALNQRENPSFPQAFRKEPRTACLTREAERPRGSPEDLRPSAAAPGDGSSSAVSPNAALGTPARATGSPDRAGRHLIAGFNTGPSDVGTRPTAGSRGRFSPAPHCEESGRPCGPIDTADPSPRVRDPCRSPGHAPPAARRPSPPQPRTS